MRRLWAVDQLTANLISKNSKIEKNDESNDINDMNTLDNMKNKVSINPSDDLLLDISDGNNEIDFDEFVAVMSRKVNANYSADQVFLMIFSK